MLTLGIWLGLAGLIYVLLIVTMAIVYVWSGDEGRQTRAKRVLRLLLARRPKDKGS